MKKEIHICSGYNKPSAAGFRGTELLNYNKK